MDLSLILHLEAFCFLTPFLLEGTAREGGLNRAIKSFKYEKLLLKQIISSSKLGLRKHNELVYEINKFYII